VIALVLVASSSQRSTGRDADADHAHRPPRPRSRSSPSRSGAVITVNGAARGVAPVNLAASVGAEVEIRAELARLRPRCSA
jgi:hypothetical protein